MLRDHLSETPGLFQISHFFISRLNHKSVERKRHCGRMEKEEAGGGERKMVHETPSVFYSTELISAVIIIIFKNPFSTVIIKK